MFFAESFISSLHVTCYKGTLTTVKPSALKSLANIIAAAAAAEAWTAAASSSSVVVFLQRAHVGSWHVLAIFLHNSKGIGKLRPQAFWERHFFRLFEMLTSLQEA
jgi:hypothetical protein